MSDESSPKNVASVWILVVLVGGLSVPFWRWDNSSSRQAEPLQWVDPLAEGNKNDNTAAAPMQHSLVSATTGSQPEGPSQLLQEFANSDPGLQIQDAVKENQQRPGIPKQFEGAGIPLTDIKPWLPKPMGYDATPSDRQKFAGNVDRPIQAPMPNGNSSVTPNTIANSNSPASRWPDAGFQGITPPSSSTMTYYRAEPNANVAASDNNNLAGQMPSGSNQPSTNGPGRMVSNSNSTPSDPPALSGVYPASPPSASTAGQQSQNGNAVRVAPSPAITPPANPLRPGQRSPSISRRPGTVISQPKPPTGNSTGK